MLRLDRISKSFGGRQLFDELSWQMPESGCVGLVGPNGTGKTTLLRIIAGEEDSDSGEIVVPRDLQLGYLPQELDHSLDQGSPMSVILEGARYLLELETKMRTLENEMSTDPSHALVERYDELQEQFRRRGGYSKEGRARAIAAGMGFREDQLHTSLSTFSGGWRMRALLGQLLMQAPDVLLLDEPTNHLDLETIEWLEGHLGHYQGTIVLISHDRTFLNRMTTQTAELSPRGVTIYQGSFDDYERQRDAEYERLSKAAAEQQKEIEQIERFVERFRYKATKAAQVQSRIKQLEKIERVDVLQTFKRDIHFQFPQPARSGKDVLIARELRKAYGDHVVYESLDFTLRRGEKVALVGPNGAGKTTLLKLLAGRLEADRGRVERGHNVDVAFFAQHAVDQLDMRATVLHEMQAAASHEAQPRVRSILGAFHFSGDEVDKRISVLSGGEKTRLALAKMMLEPANCLLLDEPTNHLDMDSRHVLEHALRRYEGAFCVVSHDRSFLNSVVDKVVHIGDGRAVLYDGNYDYYRWKREQEAEEADGDRAEDAGSTNAAGSRREEKRLKSELRRERAAATRQAKRELEELEATIASIEEQVAELEAQLGDPSTYDTLSGEAVSELQRTYHGRNNELEDAYARWETLQLELEAIEAQFEA